MKTIFVTSFHPHISRNILSAGVLSRLAESARVVLVTPDYKKNFFKANFDGPNIEVEGVPAYQASKNWRGLLFKKLGIFLFGTGTAKLKTKYKYYNDKKFFYFVFAMLSGFIGKFFWVRTIVRFLDQKFSPKRFFKDLIAKNKPDAIFFTDPQNENDVSLLHDARDANIPIIAMLRSWDNTTQRILRVLPDKLLVGSKEVKKEVLEMYKYPKEKIVVTGNPHYDKYIKGPTKSKENFFAEFGLDTQKKLITYAPVGDHLVTLNDIDQHVMEVLSELKNYQILVRFPPDEGVRLVNFKKPANMFFDKPGHAFKSDEFGDREIRPEDDERLINEIYHSDLMITGPTSISLDSALIDKPVITVNFYPSARHFFDGIYTNQCDHIQKLLRTGGIKHASSKEDFIKFIYEYLQNPKLDAEGRAKIRSMWFSHADGKASERVANEVTNFINT
ncbi:MAG: CDP-glycerol glycerophosphotransferase family protein [Patescibacteria group bacterium]